MNAVEIEEAISKLAEQPFDAAEFPYAFLEAFGNKATTIKRLRSGSTNASDIEAGVLQRNNVHIAVAEEGNVTDTLAALKQSPATKKAKAKFIVATDGKQFEAEDLTSDDAPIVCEYKKFPDHFGFFLPLAGISTVKQIRESSIDIKATGRLNRLYIQLLKDNPEWGKAERRHDMNHFMSRLIFCFFAEDTDIFNGEGLFTATIDQMSDRDSSNTHEVMSEVFRAMDTKISERDAAKLPRWADQFPYVNGGLFSGSTETPKFSKIARSYLIHIGSLDWTKINPDIFGSMIQAVTDEKERSSLGLHYTSVPNILKVLNPLFLDDLREKLEEAGDSPIKLLNLRKRMSKIRVFDPACGSGNFLVIAYKEMRAIEAEINQRRSESGHKTEIPLTNFRGIELRDFPAEIARLALIIAEYQCDVMYRGQKDALAEFLPLDAMNWIVQGNALQLDWLSVCPPTGADVRIQANDLFESPLDQAEIDFDNEGGETYICGNPPYLGSRAQSKVQKSDLEAIFKMKTKNWKQLDYVSGWFMKAADFGVVAKSKAAFVSTNSICQGQQVPVLWPLIFESQNEIEFATIGFKWTNLAKSNAGVTVVVIGISAGARKRRTLHSGANSEFENARVVDNINPYLLASENIFVAAQKEQISNLGELDRGSAPTDDGEFTFSQDEYEAQLSLYPELKRYFHLAMGSSEFINGVIRWILKLDEISLNDPKLHSIVQPILNRVKKFRQASTKAATKKFADRPSVFPEDRHFKGRKIFVPQLFSEKREYVTCGLLTENSLILAPHFQIDGSQMIVLALISSRTHKVWISTVCGQLETRLRYSNTLGWNTFPVPILTEKNKKDLESCAEDILLAREAHFPATIAELYDPEKMPENLRLAHERNDEVLERIYIGRRFKNDTERLEKLFEMYSKMTKSKAAS
ncbi:lactate dehydrogenase [Marinomonas sp. RSW2]|uniref:site-specific DNA-methyltransferase (adenine-specific) n=1 Tax=Marinomonas maritima TaxID=2940935 RepID=A0ABT5W9V2_9GAMM|nr:DNA methyltransferase [Marinomonas maritima]MDE8601596.1 lactate dehydrogenase [Marinomonas maritima]